MRIAVCDDNQQILDSFRRMLPAMGVTDARYYSSAEAILSDCVGSRWDMVFIDIILGEVNGIETAAEICRLQPQTHIVFITAFVSRYAEEIFYGVRPYAYIGKPVAEEKVRACVARLTRELERMERRLTITRGGMELDIPLADILYIESDRRRAIIHRASDLIEVYEKLDDLEARLDDRFVRCHQSYLVNMDCVANLEPAGFMLRSGETLALSRARMADTRKTYFEYKGRSII